MWRLTKDPKYREWGWEAVQVYHILLVLKLKISPKMWSEFWPQKKTRIPTKHHEWPSNMGYQLTFKKSVNPVNEYEPCPGSGEFLPNRRRIHWDPWCLPGSWEDLISIAFQKIPSTRLVETRMMCNSRSSWRRPSSTFTCSSVTSISSARTSGSSTQRWHWSTW